MLLKLPTIVVAASAAAFCLAAPAIGGNGLSARESFADLESTNHIPSAISGGLPPGNDDIVGIAKRATAICGCPPGKVGYFIHGHCACSGDPVTAPHGNGIPSTTGSRLDSHGPSDVYSGNKRSVVPERDLLSTRSCPKCPNHEVPFRLHSGQCTCIHLQERIRSTEVEDHCPRCADGSRSWKDSSRNCHCSQFEEKRELSVVKVESLKVEQGLEARKICIFALNCPYMSHPVKVNGKCTCVPVSTKLRKKRNTRGSDTLQGRYPLPSTSWEHLCAMYEKCPPGSIGVVVSDGRCQCQEQKLARLTTRDDKPQGLHIGPAPASWQLQCVVYKICPPGYRGSVVKDGTCQCQPKKVGRSIPFSDELYMKREALNPGFSPSPEAQLRCIFSKACLPGYRGSIDDGQCVYKESNKERDVAILEDFQEKRDVSISRETEEGNNLVGRQEYTDAEVRRCFNSSECNSHQYGEPINRQCVCVPIPMHEHQDRSTLGELHERRDAPVTNEIKNKRALIGGGSMAAIWRCIYQSNCNSGIIGKLVNGKCVCTKLTGVPPHEQLQRTGIEHPPSEHKAVEINDVEIRTKPADPLECGIGPRGCPHGQHHWVVDGLCTCIRYGEEDRRDLSIPRKNHERQSQRIGRKRDVKQGSPQSHCPNLKCQAYELVAYAYGQYFCKARLRERDNKQHVTADQCASKLCPAHERASLDVKGNCECLWVLQGRERDRSMAAELQEKQTGLVGEKRVWRNPNPTDHPRLCPAMKCPPHLYPFKGRDGQCHCMALKKARSATVIKESPDIQGDVAREERDTEHRSSHLTCVDKECPLNQRALIVAGQCQCVHFLEQRQWSASCSGFQCPYGFTPTLNGGMCFCNKNPGTNCPNPPGPPKLKLPHKQENRGVDIQVHLTNSVVDSCPPPQPTHDNLSAGNVCSMPQCQHASISHSDEIGGSIQQIEKRQDLASCEYFSCPAGFTPKLNGDVCYCGIDRHSPYPQGPANFGPHGGPPGNYEQDLPPASVDLDDKAGQTQKRDHLSQKRQNANGCQNLGCPSGYIPSLDGGVCYCGIDGDFPYPQAPASRGPNGAGPYSEDGNEPSSTPVALDGDTDGSGSKH